MSVKKQIHTNGNGTGEAVEGEDYIVTSKGVRIDVQAVSEVLLKKTQTSGVMPPVPYRELKATAFGESQKEELSAEDLQNDEEKKAWAEYTKARDVVQDKRNNDFLKAIFVRGTVVDEAGIDAWKTEQIEEWGFEIPDKNLDMKLEYIQMELAPSPEDQMKIVLGVLGKSGLPEKELEDMRTMFRGALRKGSTEPTEN